MVELHDNLDSERERRTSNLENVVVRKFLAFYIQTHIRFTFVEVVYILNIILRLGYVLVMRYITTDRY